METLVPLLLIVAALPFVLPIVSLVRQAGLRRRIYDLEQALEQQQHEIDALTARLALQQAELSGRLVPLLPFDMG